MWCQRCQQDVPVFGATGGGPACPRCRASLAPSGEAGVALELFDATSPVKRASAEAWALQADAYELRRIGRKLQRSVRFDAPASLPRVERTQAETSTSVPASAAPRLTPVAPAVAPALPRRAWRDGFASVIADAGLMTALAAAGMMLLQHKGYLIADFWRWGALGAGISSMVFAVGVRGLATRAWRRGSELEDQLAALRQRLEQLSTSHVPRRSDADDEHGGLGVGALAPETPPTRHGRPGASPSISSRGR
jgi:hypothetical protein